MSKLFWQERWSEQRIGFHNEVPNPNLLRYWPEVLAHWGGDASVAEVGVPLCGKSVDLRWLAERVATVTGVEFVEQAAREFFGELGQTADVTMGEGLAKWQYDNLRFLVGDIFDLNPTTDGRVDIIYDRAALVAIPQERHVAYVQRLKDWLKPTGVMLLISFDHDMAQGPPNSVTNIAALMSEGVRCLRATKIESHSLFDSEPRWKDRCTYMNEEVWLIA